MRVFLKSSRFWLSLIIIIGAWLRFYKLGQVPSGFVNDEADFGYNAYSLIKTAKDEFGQSWPIIFRSFGDGKMPVYFYLTLPSVLIFGLTEFAVRFPSALFGSLTVLLVYFLTKELFHSRSGVAPNNLVTRNSKLVSLLAAGVLAISPWHIHFSRAAFEANLGLFWVTLGSWLFFRSTGRKQFSWLLLSFISFTLAIFSYHAPRIFVPLWLFFLMTYFRRKLSLAKTLLAAALIVFLPWLWLSFSSSSLNRAKGITIFHPQSGITARIEQKIPESKGQSLWLIRLFHNKPVEYSLDAFRRYASHFDLDFLFFSGDPNRPRYRAPDVGQWLWVTLPFFFVGLYLAVKNKFWPLLGWLILAPLPSALTFETPSAIRSLLMVVPMAVIVALGVAAALKFLAKIKPRFFSLAFFAALAAAAIYNLIFYLDAYFIHLPVHQPYEWQGGYKQLVERVDKLMPLYKKAIITDARGTAYIYFLFYNQYDPARWQAQASQALTAPDKFGYTTIRKLDNLYFEGGTCPANPDSWPEGAGVPEADVLYVCTEEHHPEDLLAKGVLKKIDTIYFDDGQPAFVLMAIPSE